MKWNCNRIYGLLLMLVVCLSACNDDDADRTMNYTEKRCRIAVLCPEEWKDNWQEIAAWALENITEGQAGQPVKVVMELDWINEYDPDLSDRMYDIARSGDYSMIIGPTTSSSAYEVAGGGADTDDASHYNIHRAATYIRRTQWNVVFYPK